MIANYWPQWNNHPHISISASGPVWLIECMDEVANRYNRNEYIIKCVQKVNRLEEIANEQSWMKKNKDRYQTMRYSNFRKITKGDVSSVAGMEWRFFFLVPMHFRATDELNFIVKMSLSKHKFKLACLIW